MNSATKQKKGAHILLRAGLGLAALSIAAVLFMYTIVNVLVRDVIYENVISAAQSDKLIYAANLDSSLRVAKQTVDTLATFLSELPDEYHMGAIARRFVREYDFIENVFIGFSDDRLINGLSWDPPDTWISSERPWYRDAIAVGTGQIAVTEPFVSVASGNISIAISTYLPNLAGIGAVVGLSIPIDVVLTQIAEFALLEDGFLVLAGPDGAIYAHHHPGFSPYIFFCNITGEYTLGLHNIFDLPDTEHLQEAWRLNKNIVLMESILLGEAYFISTTLESSDVRLIAIVPSTVVSVPVAEYLRQIIVTLSVLLFILFAVTMAFIVFLVRNMEERRGTEERLQTIFESIPLVASLRDKNQNVLHANSEVTKFFGLSNPNEYVTRFDELSPEYQPNGERSSAAAKRIMERAFNEDKIRIEWMHKRLDTGELLPAEVSLVSVKMHGEDYLIIFVRDLREYYELQRKEREVNERIQMMFDATPLLIQYWTKDFKIVDCNQSAINFYGVPYGANTKEKYIEMLSARAERMKTQHDEVAHKWTSFLLTAFETGYSKTHFEDKMPDGNIKYAEAVGIRMIYNNETVVVTYGTDVTDLQQTLSEIREADERMQLMLDGTPVACYLISLDFEALDCNMETLSLFGFYSKEEGLKRFADVFPYSEGIKEKFDHTLREGGCRFEWELRSTNDEPFPCDIAFVRFSHKGKYVIAAYIFDLRILKEMLKGRKELDTAEENRRAKDRFIARISHEIRTPISAILGISEIELQHPDLHYRIEESFAKIHDSARVLLGIVNDILDLSTIEAGKLSVVREVYEVPSLVNDVSQLHLIYQGSKDIEFVFNIAEDIPARLIGDSLRIRQILNNLLSNAFKYTVSGTITLSLNVEDVKDDTATLIITVEDTGLGMTKEQLDALHSEYTRFHEDHSTAIGTGLGMSIVYSLVKMMDANLNIESEPDVGTKVTVRIPQETSDSEILNSDIIDSLQKFEVSTHVIGGKKYNFIPEPMPYGRVLIVDDIEANLYVARGLLLFYDLQIETCNSGRQAIDKIKEGKIYDVIFMDHTMPDLSGTETMQLLRKMGYHHPIVVLTANALIGHSDNFLKNGFDGFISKPINTTHLNSILVKYVKNKTAAGAQSAMVDIDSFLSDPDVLFKLRTDFAKTQRDAAVNMRRALDDSDIKTAYRLSHSLKGLAGLIKEDELTKRAQLIEDILRNESATADDIPEDMFNNMTNELARVLESIGPLAEHVNFSRALNKEKAAQTFDRLEPLLRSRNIEANAMLNELREIPESDELIDEIERFNFAKARDTLEKLREMLGV